MSKPSKICPNCKGTGMNPVKRSICGWCGGAGTVSDAMNQPNNNLSKNASGCNDPVACAAIGKTDKERQRLTKLMETIFNICDLAGFHLEERIVLRDKKTGKIWR